MIKKLAKIKKAHLEIKEKGILNFWIHVNYEDGFCQGIGGIALDTWDEDKGERVGTAYGCELIRRILTTLDVNDFAEMKDKIVWVYCDNDSLNGKAIGISGLKVNGCKNKLIFDDVTKDFGI